MHPVFLQAIYYAVAMGLMVTIIAFFMRGFFWKYLKVRMSLGKLVLIKIRSQLRDYYKIGTVIEGMLEYKTKDRDGKKQIVRLQIPKNKIIFYKSIGVTMVDVDEERNAIACIDFSTVTGFDAIKWNNLFIRALTRPTISTNKEKIIIIALVIIAIVGLAAAYFGYMNYKELLALKKNIPAMFEALKQSTAVIKPASGI